MTWLSQADGDGSADDRLRDVADHLNRNDAAGALALIKPLLTATPSIAARFALAMTAWRLERFDWSLSLLRGCHEEAPDNGGVAEALASLQAQLGQLEESLFTGKLATALGDDPALAALIPSDYPGFDRAFLSIVERPLLEKARNALAEGKLDRAVEFARQHVVLDAGHIEGRAFYAQCLMRAGAAGAAVETLSAIAEGSPAAPIASLYARALTAVGERQAALRWHRHAAASAMDDGAAAAAQIADAPFLDIAMKELSGLSADWIARFALAPKTARKYISGKKLVIGYLVSAFIDPEDAAAVAAVAQAHDRARVTVLGFGFGDQTAEHNAALIGAFGKWRDIGALDPATLARTLSGDGVDVLVDAGGFASAQQLRALTRFATGLRVSWLGNPAGLLAPAYDTRLTPADYPVLDPRAASARNETVSFGADATLAQLDPRTVALWAAVLAIVPGAKLVLRARDMAIQANLSRLIERFGENLAARIDLRMAARASEFYQAVDIALLPRFGASPRAAAEALANGVPAIATSGGVYGDFLSGRGLGQFVAQDPAHYVSLAAALACEPQARRLPAIETGARKLAQTIEEIGTTFNRRETAA